MMTCALRIEELSLQESQDKMKKEFSMIDVQLDEKFSFNADRHELPHGFEDMSLRLMPMEKYNSKGAKHEKDWIFAQVDSYHQGRIHCKMAKQTINLESKYFIRFSSSQSNFCACFEAINLIRERKLIDFFYDFENAPDICERENVHIVEDFEWFNQKIATNMEQMTAVKNIVNCTAYPFFHVVFGPPGTGKTSCIIECIAQILKAKPTARIMVTAQSNSACDEVGVRLLKYVSNSKIFRFYSPTMVNLKSSKAILRGTSN